MKKILLADDDLYIRELYEELLRTEGYEVVAVADGEAALIEAMKGGYDLILMDIIMPKKDGITFIKEYRNLKPTTPNGKVVMMSVLGEDPIIKSCLALGAAGFIVKSESTPDQILKEIKSYLETDSPTPVS